MKKLCLVIFLFFTLPLNVFAKTGISFIYINGSNVNDPQINKWYNKGIRKFHPSIKNAFEQNPSSQKYFLKDGEYFIEEAPVTFFWGDKNYQKSVFAREDSYVSKGLVTWIARQIRKTVLNVLHDIIWAQNFHNMTLILNDLHETVGTELKKCNKIVLYGYSSGSIIAYEYLLTRTPYINVAEFFNSINATKEQIDFVSRYPMKNTCISALMQKIAISSSDGNIILNNDFNSFKKNYMNLNEETYKVCIPDNSVLGVIDIASPLVLFYSDISDPAFQLTYYNKLLYKYIRRVVK
ncbi:MAG: hypothetical protein PHC64_10395 [Candidatus Gastranaerophilales bacterium]|nr:hypothetical protein [Candidatus Gastranaerophilales bacterium]